MPRLLAGGLSRAEFDEFITETPTPLSFSEAPPPAAKRESESKRIRNIDGLRALAVIVVIIFHL